MLQDASFLWHRIPPITDLRRNVATCPSLHKQAADIFAKTLPAPDIAAITSHSSLTMRGGKSVGQLNSIFALQARFQHCSRMHGWFAVHLPVAYPSQWSRHAERLCRTRVSR